MSKNVPSGQTDSPRLQSCPSGKKERKTVVPNLREEGRVPGIRSEQLKSVDQSQNGWQALPTTCQSNFDAKSSQMDFSI